MTFYCNVCGEIPYGKRTQHLFDDPLMVDLGQVIRWVGLKMGEDYVGEELVGL